MHYYYYHWKTITYFQQAAEFHRAEGNNNNKIVDTLYTKHLCWGAASNQALPLAGHLNFYVLAKEGESLIHLNHVLDMVSN